jgi:hypothetical protein
VLPLFSVVVALLYLVGLWLHRIAERSPDDPRRELPSSERRPRSAAAP